MTSQPTLVAADPASDRLAAAAVRLYDAEVALHIARQSRVDSWIGAAYDRLHLALGEHTAALAERATAHARCA